jgi:ferredoxin
MPHRCIQCGECIRACPWGAWTAQGDSLNRIKESGSRAWALLDPSVFGQFIDHASPQDMMDAFRQIGFFSVREMGKGLEVYGNAVSDFLSSNAVPLPAISSDCPAVVQLVRVKFPSLLENLIPVIPPYEIMARELKEAELKDSSPDLYYIVPCLAKAQAAVEPLSPEGGFTGAVPLADLYNALSASLRQKDRTQGGFSSGPAFPFGLQWSFTGGESIALGLEASLTVDGIHHVADVLDLAENGLLAGVSFIEAWSCHGGCLGGSLNVQNPFWARFRLLSWMGNHFPLLTERVSKMDSGEKDRFRLPHPITPRGGMRLDEDLRVAMEKLRRIDEAVKKFPGIDCGSCGCPNCLALAEDVVQGHASQKDCLYVLKEALKTRREGKGRSSKWKRRRARKKQM